MHFIVSQEFISLYKIVLTSIVWASIFFLATFFKLQTFKKFNIVYNCSPIMDTIMDEIVMDSSTINNIFGPYNFVLLGFFWVDFPFDPIVLLTCAHA